MNIIYTDSFKVYKPERNPDDKKAIVTVDIKPKLQGLYHSTFNNRHPSTPLVAVNIDAECVPNATYPLVLTADGIETFKKVMEKIKRRIYFKGETYSEKDTQSVRPDNFTIVSIHFLTLARKGFMMKDCRMKLLAIVSEVFDGMDVDIYLYS